ncbi:MAG: helix-turn-helix domain-containing protein [Microthrixaceae bacterium]|nr:helix-turn-helix domain-containing protein [Microthrixaceae bacterium]
MGKPPGSVYTILRLNGGVWRPRRRRVGHLTLAEREAFSRGVAGGESRRAIAKRLGRAPSTVSREVTRNKGCTGIGRSTRTTGPGIGRGDRSRAYSRPTRSWASSDHVAAVLNERGGPHPASASTVCAPSRPRSRAVGVQAL